MLSMASPSRLFTVQVTGTSFMRGAGVDSQKQCERDLYGDVSAGAWRLCAVVSRLPSPGMSNGPGHCERLRVGGNGRRATLCIPLGLRQLIGHAVLCWRVLPRNTAPQTVAPTAQSRRMKASDVAPVV